MTLIIFIIVLALLIFVHELGHFIAAKATGMRVDEFGIGFPPRLFSKKVGETVYSINMIPFGGYVKIFGEDADEEKSSETEEVDKNESLAGSLSDSSKTVEDDYLLREGKGRSFSEKPKWAQAVVLLAGVFGNILLAWLLISFGFMSGLPTSVSGAGSYVVEDARLVITSVIPNSPAEEAGLKAGDVIHSMRSDGIIYSGFDSVERAQRAIMYSFGPILISYERGDISDRVEVYPEEDEEAGTRLIGVTLDMIGTAKLPLFASLYEGAKLTVFLTGAIAVAIGSFLFDAFRGAAEFSQVAGPVGIAGLVGDASRLGFVYLMSFTAFISINLAILNMIPFPALDGGRLLFVLIESIRRKRISPKVANTLNMVGFALLILLMIVVTFNDIVRLF